MTQHPSDNATILNDMLAEAGVASDEYRDGVAAGARITVERVIAAIYMGIVLTPEQIRAIADTVRSEYGGRALTDAEAREKARVA